MFWSAGLKELNNLKFILQMSTSLFLQSERMDIRVGNAKMPAAMLNIFNTIIILILIPIMDRIVYPLLAKFNRSPSHLQRMGKDYYSGI